MINTLVDIMRLIERYQQYLDQNGVSFDGRGFPSMRRDWYLDEWPDQVVTYRERKSSRLVTDPARTVLCFYCADERIYPRWEHVLEELDEYRPSWA